MCGALLYHTLSSRFGDSRVFLDSSTILAGDDFEQTILGRLRESNVLLAVIGPNWLSAANGPGGRHIDSPNDWVRRELAEAFALGLPVIPVLIYSTSISPGTVL